MTKKAAVVGLGETGYPLFQIISLRYPDAIGYDPKIKGFSSLAKERVDFLNICIPWNPDFMAQVLHYKDIFRPEVTIIHSTVPVGTTRSFESAVHSPILGRHGGMVKSLLEFKKWVGGERAGVASEFLMSTGIPTRTVLDSDTTELMKLMCLAKYGKDIAFRFFQQELCEMFKVPAELISVWDRDYNAAVHHDFRRPIIEFDHKGKIGGHCVIPGTRLLNTHLANPMLREVLKYE